MDVKKTCFIFYENKENEEGEDNNQLNLLGNWQVTMKNPRDTTRPFVYTVCAFQHRKDEILYRAWDKKVTPSSPNDDFFNLKAEFVFNIKTKTISTQTTTIVSDADFFALWYTFIKNFKNLGVFRLCLDCSIYEKLKPLFVNVWKMKTVAGNEEFLEIHVEDAVKGFEKSPNCVL